MSRLRTGHTPDAWTDDGPATPHRIRGRYSTLGGSLVTEHAKPPLTEAQKQAARDKHNRYAALRRERERA